MRAFEGSEIEDIESHPSDNDEILSARFRNQREDINYPSLAPKTEIVTLAMRALPPVLPFQRDHQTDCIICMEDFQIGELVQPFGVCSHYFHIFCINSWLRLGKINCPVCRKELSFDKELSIDT